MIIFFENESVCERFVIFCRVYFICNEFILLIWTNLKWCNWNIFLLGGLECMMSILISLCAKVMLWDHKNFENFWLKHGLVLDSNKLKQAERIHKLTDMVCFGISFCFFVLFGSGRFGFVFLCVGGLDWIFLNLFILVCESCERRFSKTHDLCLPY